MTDDQRAMYGATVALRNNEVALRWTRTQLFFLIHSASLSFVTTQMKLGEWVHIGACFVGIILAFLWFKLIKIIEHFIEYWDSCLERLERDTVPRQPIRVFGGRRYWRAIKIFGAHNVLMYLVQIFLLVWLALFVLSVFTHYTISLPTPLTPPSIKTIP